ncbi:MAG TPA: bifunctional serine/threonine-protein kinase/formylglycine-generating enzyme family protein, partial [Parachlamydiaceae bacterium]|nr:bifunctional serine/threonine-protein kinase/formylglycine-generating enzyme family protein [Parachlamydiaceae bacterium]
MMESRILGDYTILKQIGLGSFGAVYLAEHRYMKKQYILKVLGEEFGQDRSFIQRFEEDVTLLSSLDHPSIVKIHNISFSQGQYFLVADCVVDDLLETTNLAQYLTSKKNNISENQVFHILSQIASALDYAHQKKIAGKEVVHGCLKLNNILIGKNKAEGPHVLISDFGLSRIIGAGTALSSTYKNMAESLSVKADRVLQDSQKLLQLNHSFAQNFAFLAPEQKKLDFEKAVDSKADIYAFGVLAYFLLMHEFPEGFFEMPGSSSSNRFEKNWDILLQNCLASNPLKRPEFLLPLLEMTTKPKQKEISTFKEVAAVNIEAPVEKLKPFFAGAHLDVASIKPQPVIYRAELKRPETDLDPASVFQIDTTVKHYTPELKEVKNIQPLRSELVIIPGGEFVRGSNDGNRDETPRHQVHLSSFAIDVHPVTNEQFVRFLEVMGGEKNSNHQDVIRLRDSRIKKSGGKISIESGYAKHPVVGVTWYGSMAYAKWVGMRLPTEAEWEIAACGGL